MPPTSRRIFLYWLLLLVPALVVGGAAIYLLRNEQRRLVQTGEYAEESRRAAIAARARLIVENVELLVGDVEAGLLDSLAAEATPDPNSFLERWEKSNPLVRIAFLGTSGGRILRPDARSAGEDGRGFLRRFERQFGARAPWVSAVPENETGREKREQAKVATEDAVRKDVSSNVAQVQSARRAVQELFTAQNKIAAAPTSAAPTESENFGVRSRSSPGPTGAADRAATAPAASGALSRSLASASERKAVVVAPAPALAQAATADRRGWVPATIDGRFHLFGWVQPGGAGDVRGVEIELSALVSRLSGTMPVEVATGEGYALRDSQGRVLHQVGAVTGGGEPTLRVPVAAGMLPGWEVAAYAAPGLASASESAAFFWAGVLLVVLFVGAILVGGSMLWWQAQRSEQEAAQKTSFVANVSHEFKTPLTTIRLYSELLEQGRVRDSAQGAEYLRTIGRETQRLARLVNNALDFSRLEQGRKKYAREEIDLGAELNRCLDTHAPRLAEAGLVLKREFPTAPLALITDRDALGQIVLNLLDNACKYAADGGEITVSARLVSGGGAEVRVADRGPGVPPEHRERIFEKFHRVDDALIAEKTGAGLGLSIARQLARGLGGDLRYAERAGAGAEFVLQLPASS